MCLQIANSERNEKVKRMKKAFVMVALSLFAGLLLIGCLNTNAQEKVQVKVYNDWMKQEKEQRVLRQIQKKLVEKQEKKEAEKKKKAAAKKAAEKAKKQAASNNSNSNNYYGGGGSSNNSSGGSYDSSSKGSSSGSNGSKKYSNESDKTYKHDHGSSHSISGSGKAPWE